MVAINFIATLWIVRFLAK